MHVFQRLINKKRKVRNGQECDILVRTQSRKRYSVYEMIPVSNSHTATNVSSVECSQFTIHQTSHVSATNILFRQKQNTRLYYYYYYYYYCYYYYCYSVYSAVHSANSTQLEAWVETFSYALGSADLLYCTYPTSQWHVTLLPELNLHLLALATIIALLEPSSVTKETTSTCSVKDGDLSVNCAAINEK